MWLLAALVAVSAASVCGTPCAHARTRCAYRTGCGAALSNYIVMCDTVLSEPVKSCPEECGHALIALTSTEEGKELMNVSISNPGLGGASFTKFSKIVLILMKSCR